MQAQTTLEKNWFKNCLENKDLLEKIKKIKLIITDVDGALTDGQVLIQQDYISKSFSVQDGFIIDRTLKNNLLNIAFLSGRKDEVTKKRAHMLGVPDDMCFIGFCGSKVEKLNEILKTKNLTKEQTLYFGDDFLDIELKPHVSLLACPTNTPFYFQQEADILVPRDGGNHTFRLLLDLILYVQKKHPFAQKFIEKALK